LRLFKHPLTSTTIAIASVAMTSRWSPSWPIRCGCGKFLPGKHCDGKNSNGFTSFVAIGRTRTLSRITILVPLSSLSESYEPGPVFSITSSR
jgi:hypothetical protein